MAIVIIIAIVILFEYYEILMSAPPLIAFLVVYVAFIIISLVLLHSAKSKDYFTFSDNTEIEEAKKKDRIAAANNATAKKARITKNKEKYAPKLEAVEAEIARIQNEISTVKAKLRAGVLSEEDCNEITIDFLIGQLRSGRADSIKEALLQYDEKRDRDNARAFADSMAYLDRLERKRNEQRRNDLENEHRYRMEDLERRRLKEAEETNRLLRNMKNN